MNQPQTQPQIFPPNRLISPMNYLPPITDEEKIFPQLDFINIHHLISLIANSVWLSLEWVWYDNKKKATKIYKLFNGNPENFARHLYKLYFLSLLRIVFPHLTDKEVRLLTKQKVKRFPLQYENFYWDEWYEEVRQGIILPTTDLTDITPVPPRTCIMIYLLDKLLNFYESGGLCHKPYITNNIVIQTLVEMLVALENIVGTAWVSRYLTFLKMGL